MNNVVIKFNYDKKTNLINNIKLAKLKESEDYIQNAEYMKLKEEMLKDNIHSINFNITLFENLYSDYPFSKAKAYEYAYFEMEKAFEKYDPAIAKKTKGAIKGCSFWWYSQSGIRNGIKKSIKEDLGVKHSEFAVLNFVNAYFKNNGEMPSSEILGKSYINYIAPKTLEKALETLGLKEFMNFDKEVYRKTRYNLVKSAKQAVKGIENGMAVLTEHFLNGKKHKEYVDAYNLTVNQVRYISRKIIKAFADKLAYDNIKADAYTVLKSFKSK